MTGEPPHARDFTEKMKRYFGDIDNALYKAEQACAMSEKQGCGEMGCPAVTNTPTFCRVHQLRAIVGDHIVQDDCTRECPAPSHLSPDDRGWDQGFADGQASALADCNICSEKIRKTEKQRVYGLINSDEIAIRNATLGMIIDLIKKTDEGACPHNQCRRGDGHDNLNCRDCLLAWIDESLRTKEHP